MNQADISPSSKMRIIFAVTAAAMLVLWGLSLIPPITTWGDPNEDGFTYVPVSYATLSACWSDFTCSSAPSPAAAATWRAPAALFVGGGVIFIVVAFLILQHIANSMIEAS